MLARFYRFGWLVTLGCFVLLGYFAFHAFQGQRGYHHLEIVMGQVEKLASDLAKAKSQLAELESRVVLMRPEHVDPDMLEELAREQLELSRPNELIVRARQ